MIAKKSFAILVNWALYEAFSSVPAVRSFSKWLRRACSKTKAVAVSLGSAFWVAAKSNAALNCPSRTRFLRTVLADAAVLGVGATGLFGLSAARSSASRQRSFVCQNKKYF